MQKKLLNNTPYLTAIKKILKADFVGWVTEKDKKSLKIKMQGKEFLLPLEGEEINHETYMDLIRHLMAPNETDKIKQERAYKALYESLLESEDLPHMSGDWEKDKKDFIKAQLEIESLLTDENYDNEEQYTD